MTAISQATASTSEVQYPPLFHPCYLSHIGLAAAGCRERIAAYDRINSIANKLFFGALLVTAVGAGLYFVFPPVGLVTIGIGLVGIIASIAMKIYLSTIYGKHIGLTRDWNTILSYALEGRYEETGAALAHMFREEQARSAHDLFKPEAEEAFYYFDTRSNISDPNHYMVEPVTATLLLLSFIAYHSRSITADRSSFRLSFRDLERAQRLADAQRCGRTPAQREFFNTVNHVREDPILLEQFLALQRIARSIATPTRISAGHSILYSTIDEILSIQDSNRFDDAGNLRTDSSGIGNLQRWKETLNVCRELLSQEGLYGPAEQLLVERMLNAETMRDLWEIVTRTEPQVHAVLEPHHITYRPASTA